MSRVLVLIIVTMSLGGDAAWADGWSRGVPLGTWTQEDAIKHFKRFELVVWSGEDDRVLYGLCTFTNVTQALFAIDGTVSEDGDFYPTVAAEVANREDGEWRTVGRSLSRGPARDHHSGGYVAEQIAESRSGGFPAIHWQGEVWQIGTPDRRGRDV